MIFTFDTVPTPSPSQSQMANVQPCYVSRCTTDEAETVASRLGEDLTAPVILQDVMSLVNLVIQLVCIRYIMKRNYMKTGSFFTMLFILSISISIRVIFYTIALSTTAITSNSSNFIIQLLTTVSLYVDYISNFFSLVVTFLMSLNRCFCFVSHKWMWRIFGSDEIGWIMIVSGLTSTLGAVVCIGSSKIHRQFLSGLGYVDIGSGGGYKVLVNRLFFIFPIGSIICYIVLFYTLRLQNKQVLTKSSNRNKGERKVFVQLLITTVLYGVMAIFYEVITLVEWTDLSVQLDFISIFSVLNYLPEISLPLLLVCSSVQIRKKVSQWIAPKTDRTIVTEPPKTTTTTAEN